MTAIAMPRQTVRTALLLCALGAACSDDEELVPLTIVSFESSATEVEAGRTVTLTWAVDGAIAVGVEQASGTPPRRRTILAGGAGTGEVVSDPIDLTTTFTLTATGAGGQVETRSLNVNATGISVVRFEAVPATIARGQQATLEWTLGGSPPSEVVVTNSAGDELFRMPARFGSVTVAPTQTETYTLSAQAAGVRAERSATVTVTSAPPTINRFEAQVVIGGAPRVVTTVARGQTLTLVWEVDNVQEVQIRRNGVIRRPWNAGSASSGNRTEVATEDRNVFLIEARNGMAPEDLSTQELVVMTSELPTIDRFEVTPETYTTGSTVASASWTVRLADEVRLEVGGVPVPGAPTTLTGQASFSVAGAATVRLVATNEVGETAQTREIELGFDDREPNDTLATAIPIPADGLPVRGTLTSTTDVDFYRLTVGEGQFVVARVDDADGGDCAALRPRLALFDGAGQELGERRGAGATSCAEIIPPEYAGFAERLAAGTYFLRVSGEGTAELAGRYSLTVRALSPIEALNSVTVTPIPGAPPATWSVTDFVVATTEWGRAADNFPSIVATQDQLLGTRHQRVGANILTVIGRPAAPSVSDFSQEMRTMAAVLGLENETQFEAAQWRAPNGLIAAYTLVPVATSTGTSRDFPNPPGGPVIPNRVLPITVAPTVTLGAGDPLAFPNTPLTVPGDPAADGLSHLHVLHALGEAVFQEPPALPLVVSWGILLQDNSDAGYIVRFTTSIR